MDYRHRAAVWDLPSVRVLNSGCRISSQNGFWPSRLSLRRISRPAWVQATLVGFCDGSLPDIRGFWSAAGEAGTWASLACLTVDDAN